MSDKKSNEPCLLMADVRDFHHKYGIQYEGPKRKLPTQDERGDNLHQFRTDRLSEEVQEYVDAHHEGSLADCLDAHIDLIYIALGNLHFMGFSPEEVQEAWDRVHRANMAKEIASKANPGRYGCRVDIVKPPGWVAPNHDDLCVEEVE